MAHDPKHDNRRRGIAMMLLACLFFSLMDAVMKRLAADFPAIQVTALRSISSLPLILAYVHWRGAWHTLRRVRWPLHLFRMALGVAMLTLFAFALKSLPLTEAYALFYISPLAIAALSIPFLGERVPRASWIAIAVGLLGVLVVLNPRGEGLVSLAGLAVLAAALCYAIAAVAGRLLSRTDSIESLILTMMVFMTVGGGLMAAPGWVAVSWEHAGLLLALAITGFLGQLTINEAFRHGQASAVAPFEYTALAWGVGLDWLVWQTLPEAHTWIGAAIIIGSGLYIVRHERRISEVHANAEHP